MAFGWGVSGTNNHDTATMSEEGTCDAARPTAEKAWAAARRACRRSDGDGASGRVGRASRAPPTPHTHKRRGRAHARCAGDGAGNGGGGRPHREDAADGGEGEGVVEGARVLLAVHAEADEQRRRRLPARAHEVRGRLRAAARRHRLAARKLDGEAVGSDVGDNVAEGGERHEDRKLAALVLGVGVARLGRRMRRVRAAAQERRLRGRGDGRDRLAVGVGAPVRLGEGGAREHEQEDRADRPADAHVWLAAQPGDRHRVVEQPEEELERPRHEHDDLRGRVDVARHVEVADEEAVQRRGQPTVDDTDRKVLHKVAAVLPGEDVDELLVGELLGGRLDGEGARGPLAVLEERGLLGLGGLGAHWWRRGACVGGSALLCCPNPNRVANFLP
eukprot:1465227-Prymnesium_polylepis.1